MAPGNNCRQIVRVIPGNSTGPDDDRYECADGSVWKRASPFDSNSTAPAPTAYLHGGSVCDHK